MNLSRLCVGIATLTLLFSQTACLKTRSQVRGDQPTSHDQSDNNNAEEARAPSHRVSPNDLEEVKTEINRLSGKLEEVDHNQRAHNVSEIKEYQTRLDTRIAELEKNQILMLSELKTLKDKETVAVKESAVPSSDLMTQGYQLLSEKRFEEANEKFRIILAKNVKGKEAAEAHFGMGEAEYNQKNYKKAIVQYSKVQEVHSKSTRVPTSLYRIGLAFGHLNMAKEAKGFFGELVERYPKSPEAKKARGRLKE